MELASPRSIITFQKRLMLKLETAWFWLPGLLLIPYSKDIGTYIAGKSNPAPPTSPASAAENLMMSPESGVENNTYLPSANSTYAYSVPLFDESENSAWVIVLTIIGIVMADYLSDGLQNPSRAYLLDVCEECKKKRTVAPSK